MSECISTRSIHHRLSKLTALICLAKQQFEKLLPALRSTFPATNTNILKSDNGSCQN